MKTPAATNIKFSLFSLLFSFSIISSNLQAQTTENTQPLVESDYYRIELLIFKFLNRGSQGNLRDSIEDYAITDPELDNELAEPTFSSNEPTISPNEPIFSFDEPAFSSNQPLRSEEMENAWKRLLRSNNYHPLSYIQWTELHADTVARHTPGGVSGVPLRVHGENQIQIQEQILEQTEGEVQVNKLPYKLDGLASFNQGRFLHINLDFEYRDIATIDANSAAQTDAAFIADPNATVMQQYSVFKLNETRQLIPQRMELFDNEQFGVFVFLMELNPEADVVTPLPQSTEN